MPKMWLSPATGTPCWPTGRSGQSHRSELSCKHYFTLFVKTSSDCEHQPGGSAVQGALRQPGRPRVELLPCLHQEEIDVSTLCQEVQGISATLHFTWLHTSEWNYSFLIFSAECCKFQQFCTLYSIMQYNSIDVWFRDSLLPKYQILNAKSKWNKSKGSCT